MEHVAIMRKSWKLTQKILTGEKKIESRWYKNKYPPWDKIEAGETIYFKDSGEPVTVKATVERVLQIPELTPQKVKEILEKYCRDDGIEDTEPFYELFKNKKRCMLIFLKKARAVKPFEIDKKGYGAMAAWLCVNNIKDILLPD